MLRLEWVTLAAVFVLVGAWALARNARATGAASLWTGRYRQGLPLVASPRLAGVAAGLVLAAAALIGPVIGRAPEARVERQLEVRVAVDLSRSMGVALNGITRLDYGRAAAQRLLAAVPGGRTGLVVFGSGAHTLLPLTRDGTVVNHYLQALSPNQLSGGGTTWSGVMEAAGLGDRADGADTGATESGAGAQTAGLKRLTLLVSDGEWWGDAHIDAVDAANPAADAGPVYILWTGVPRQGVPPGQQLAASPPSPGPASVSNASTAGPERLAAATGGRVVDVSDIRALDALAADLRELASGVEVADPGSGDPVDGAPLLAGIAAALLVLGSAMGRRL